MSWGNTNYVFLVVGLGMTVMRYYCRLIDNRLPFMFLLSTR